MPESTRPAERIAEVALNVPLRRTFDYLIPDALRGRVQPGVRVEVPFGNRRRELAFCVALKESAEVPESDLKAVVRLIDPEPTVTPGMMGLARWAARYYHCSLGEALCAAVPPGVRQGRKGRKVRMVALCGTAREAEATAHEVFDRSPAQSKLLRALAGMGGAASAAELKRVTGTSQASLNALRKKGLVQFEMRHVEPEDPLTHVHAARQEPPDLTHEQRKAYELITGRMDRGRFDVVLLHGVTSSGKTEVYLQCIDHLVRRGKQAIVLVPEISLTPQTIRHFGSRFARMAVLHSRLTEAERRRQWQTIRTGGADVVIGARSAVFAPVPSLGLLVVDEEHETSFKQDNVPRYHARDVGIMRARAEGALVLLGSATPSLETHHNCVTGKYTRAVLSGRIGGHPLPPVEIVDMRGEWAGRGRLRVISRRLEYLMRETLERGQQVILFMNRRGYAPFIHCPRCGFVVKCRRCDITMDYHRDIDAVTCHYCGLQQRPPSECPECALEGIRFSGTGTQRIEETVRAMFPGETVERMDSDTTQARRAHEQKLEAFRTGRTHVLIGTQMIAKGLDFPNVTTVGVVNADVGLHLPDFRSRERTFQLLAQVAGRTGRGPAGGRVVVQTFMPEDPSIRAAARHDYETFAGGELPHRRQLGYPPFGRMVRILCRAREADRVEAYAADLGAALRRLCADLGGRSHVLGPAAAPVARIRGRHRRHLLLKCPDARSVEELLTEAAAVLKGPSGVKVLVDVDPVSML
ncbi:MAG: primosomal protein N' [Candidatus Brocadiaceae bacterium]|nr:primosomal protein N' [Candidatus Brocadiaceae bacterium]